MRVLSLKARGFIGFKKGLGVDEIDLDFNRLNGLVALAGPNGHGKSTMLENLSPFRTLASRSGSLRHHTFLRDSSRELEFEMMGDVYKALIKIDADSDRSEGFVWKNGMPQVDGKVSNYNNYLVRLLGTANLFYNSVFCAQNSQRLSDMTTGDLKSLFTEFLRLDRLAGYEKTSKQCISVLDSMKGIAERRLESLQDRLEKLMETGSEIERLNSEKKEAAERIEITKQDIINTEISIQLLTQTIARNEELEKEAVTVQESRATIMGSLADHLALGEKKILYFTAEIKKTVEQIAECNKVLQEREGIERASENIAQKERRIQYWESKVKDLVKERQIATDRYISLSAIISGKTLEISEKSNAKDIQAMEQEFRDIEKKLDAKKTEVSLLEREQQNCLSTPEILQLQNDIKVCLEKTRLLEKRDPACQSQTCSFILSGIEAHKQLPGLQEDLKKLMAAGHEKIGAIDLEIEALNSEVLKISETLEKNIEERRIAQKNLDADLAILRNALFQDQARLEETTRLGKNLAKEISDGETEIRILRSLKANSEQLAARMPELEVASARHTELTRQLVAIREDQDAWNAAHLRQKDSICLAILKENVRLEEIKGKIVPEANTDLLTEKTKLLNLQQAMQETEKQLEELNNELSKQKAKTEEKTEVQKELAALEAETADYKKEISEWTYLRNACGKNGLQALEIDGVAPLITGYANDLLAQSFGPNFSVRLATQDDNGKEILDIIVIREDGSETLLENLSGGEKVWILKALRLAMTLVSKEKSGRNFQTFFSDEEDGALDGEKALNFIGLYRSLMTTGNFDTCFYISHNPDVVAMADHQIVFSESGIEVV